MSIHITISRSATASRLTIFNTNCSFQSVALSKCNWLLKQQFVSNKMNRDIRLKCWQGDASDLHKRLQLRTLKTTGKRLRSVTQKKKKRTCLILKGLLSQPCFLFFPSCLFILKPGQAAKCWQDKTVTWRTVKWRETRCSDHSKWRGWGCWWTYRLIFWSPRTAAVCDCVRREKGGCRGRVGGAAGEKEQPSQRRRAQVCRCVFLKKLASLVHPTHLVLCRCCLPPIEMWQVEGSRLKSSVAVPSDAWQATKVAYAISRMRRQVTICTAVAGAQAEIPPIFVLCHPWICPLLFQFSIIYLLFFFCTLTSCTTPPSYIFLPLSRSPPRLRGIFKS